jgi:hypothetical protein
VPAGRGDEVAAFLRELDELLNLIRRLPIEMLPLLPGLLDTPLLRAAGIDNLVRLALGPVYIRSAEEAMIARAMEESLREQPRPEPPKRVTLLDYHVSVDDFRAAKECCVCLAQFRYREKGVVKLKCGHVFHRTCLEPWFAEHHTCPMCRADIDEAE